MEAYEVNVLVRKKLIQQLLVCRNISLNCEEDALVYTALMEKIVLYIDCSTTQCRIFTVDLRPPAQGGRVIRRWSLDSQFLGAPFCIVLPAYMYSLVLALAKLILLAGDVESNPGPENEEPQLSYLATLPVAAKWRQLGIQLGFQGHELDIIEANNVGPHYVNDRLNSMFETWQKQRPFNECTYEILAGALANIGEQKLAADVYRKADFSDKEQPQLKELMQLPIKHKWEELGLKLGLRKEKLHELTLQYRADADLCFSTMIHCWLEDCSKDTSRQALIKALAEVKRPVAAYLCRKWGIPEYAMGDRILPEYVSTYAKSLTDTFKTAPILPKGTWPPTLGQHYIRLALIKRERNLPLYEVQTITKANRYTRGTIDKVLKEKGDVTLSEIFVPAEGDEVLKVLIDGAPGVGKTTLTRKICNGWANNEFLQEYSLVILAHLRNKEVKQAKTVLDLLHLTPGAVDRQALEKVHHHIVRETRGEDVLIIFDGYDELSFAERTENQGSFFSKVIAGSILPKCSVVVTSRPYASQNLQCDETFCRHVEVLGFSEKQIHSCVMQKIRPRNEADKFYSFLEERLDLMALCYIPLNLAILLYVYKQNENQLPDTITDLFQLFVLHTLNRFQKEDHGSSFDDLDNLPDALKDPFHKLCELAYRGIENDKLSFDSQDHPFLSSTTQLGLLTAETSYTAKGEKLSYQFLHLTVQEFLAAKYASLHLCEHHSELFKKHLSNDRFRLVLLFLAGISKLEHVQIEDAFEGEIDLSTCYKSNCQKFVFATHIAYEAHNTTVCHNLAHFLKDSELIFRGAQGRSFDGYDLTLFDYVVIGYFISNSCHSWKLLKFESGLTERALELLVRFPSPSNSKVVVEHVEFNCPDCSVISVVSFIEEVGWFTSTTRISISAKLPNISQEGSTFGYLLSSKLKCLEDLTVSLSYTSIEHLQWKVWVKAFETFASNLAFNAKLEKMTLENCFEVSCMKSVMQRNNVLTELRLKNVSLRAKEACNFFQDLSLNKSLKILHVNTISAKECVSEFKQLLKLTCTIEHLDLACCGLNDADVENIASGLEKNKSVVTLNLSGNNITAKGCKKLFEALSCNKNVKQLILAEMYTLTEGDTKDAGEALEQYLAMEHHTLTFLSFQNCTMDDTLILYLTRALTRNISLTEMDISRQGTFNRGLVNDHTQDSSLNYNLLLAAQRHPTLRRLTFRQAIFETFNYPQQLIMKSSAVLVEVINGVLKGGTFLEYIRRLCSGSEIWMKTLYFSGYSDAHIHLISELKETSCPSEMNILPITPLYTDADYLSTISKTLPKLVSDDRKSKDYVALISANASSWGTFRLQKEIPQLLQTGTWAKCSKISTEDCKLVFDSLKKSAYLKELEIAKTVFGKEGARSLASLLTAKVGSFQISLIECHFDDCGVKAIAAALQENTTLVLSESPKILKQFLCSLLQNSSFRKLHISSSQILASDFQDFLKKCKYLSHLHITDSHLEIDGDTIAYAILQSPSLTEVSLENLKFHPISLSTSGHKCAVTETQLIKLHIANCKLEMKAWSRLLSSLADFELESCVLTDFEAMAIAKELRKTETLSTLKLRECSLSDGGYTEILGAVKNIPALKVLDVTVSKLFSKVWPSSSNDFLQYSQLVELQVENFIFSGEASTMLLASLTQGKPLQKMQMCSCKIHVNNIKVLFEVTKRIKTVNMNKCLIEGTVVPQFAKLLQEEFSTCREIWVSTMKSLHVFVSLTCGKAMHANVVTEDDHIQSAKQMEWSMLQSYATKAMSLIIKSGDEIESMVNDSRFQLVICFRLRGLRVESTLTDKFSFRFTKSISIDAFPDYSDPITAFKVLLEHIPLEEFTVNWKDSMELKPLFSYLQEHLSEAEFWIGCGNSANAVVKLQQQRSLKSLNIKGPVKSLLPIANEKQSQFLARIHAESVLSLPFEIDIHGAKNVEMIPDNVHKMIIRKKCDVWVSLRGLPALSSSICESLTNVPLKLIEIKDTVLTLKGMQSLTNLFESAAEVNMWSCNLVNVAVPVFVSAVQNCSQTRFQISDMAFTTSEHLLRLLQEKHVSLRCIKMHPGGLPGMDHELFSLLATSKTTGKPVLSLKQLVTMRKNCIELRAKVAVPDHSRIDISLYDVNFNAFCNIAEVLLANSVPTLKEIHLIDCSLNNRQCANLADVLSKFSPNALLALNNCRFDDLKTDFVPELETNRSVTMLHLCESDVDGTTASLLWQSFRGLKMLKVEKVTSRDADKLTEILCSQNHHLSKVCITARPNLSNNMPALSTALCNKKLKFLVLNGLSTIPKFVESCLSEGLRSKLLHSLKITFLVHKYRTNISSQLVDMLRYLHINLGTLQELSLCWKVEESMMQAGYFYWSQPQKICLLMNFTLGNKSLQALADVLSNVSSTELRITNCYLTPCLPESEGWKSLSESLNHNTNLCRVVMDIRPKLPSQHLDFTDILTSVLSNTSIVKLQTNNLNLEQSSDQAKKMLSANNSLEALTSQIYSRGCITIFEGLAHNLHVKCLDISNSCSLDSEGVDALSNFLSENSTVTELNIAGCDFTRSELQKIAEGLKFNHALKTLTIGGSNSVATECIFNSIWSNSDCALQQLCVKWWTVKGSIAEALSNMLRYNQSLIELAITDCTLESSDWKCILSGIKKSKKSKLKKLHLQFNYFHRLLGYEGWADLCEVVSGLHELVLTSCNKYGDVEKCWMKLFEAIQSTNTFTKLDISGSTIGLESSQILSSIAPKLTQLNVCSSGCSELVLLKSLSKCKEEETMLEKLDLDLQGSWETVDALIEVLSVVPTLHELSVTCKSFEPLYCASLFLALKQNSSLQKLCLCSANIGMAGSEALAEMIEKNNTITQLHILKYKFSDSELRVIAQALFCHESLQCFEIDEEYRENLEDYIQTFCILNLDGGNLDSTLHRKLSPLYTAV